MMRPLLLFLLFVSFSGFSQSQEIAKFPFLSLDDNFTVRKLTLLFAGDLMQHQGQIDAAKSDSGYDYSACFRHVKDEISRADIAIANLEVTLGGKPYTGYPMFSAPDEYLKAIKEAGFDVLTTANNHCLDRRKTGLERTILMLDSLRIPHAGTYINAQTRAKRYPLLLERNGFRIVLLSYTYGTNGFKVTPPNVVNYIDKATIAKDLEAARAMHPDAIIACMHWGIEYASLPSDEQKALADWLLERGVDHVIGCHPHVVQPLEVRSDSLKQKQSVVAYSLGNFISNMSAPGTDGGLLLKLELMKSTTPTRLKNCAYSLVWTARPIFSGKKNYELRPANLSIDSLPEAARNRLKIFINNTRLLMQKHNRDINEYFFSEKNPAEYLQNKR